jgi:hypothetical protein
MTTEKLVNNALFGKTELKSEKVELGLIQDIQADLNSWYPAMSSSKQAISQISAKLVKDNQELKLVSAAIDKVERAAVELGATEIVKQAQAQRKEVIKISSSLLGANDKLISAQGLL